MRDLLADYDRLAAHGHPLGRAVVTSVWGSAPRPEGSSMLATADGTIAGSVIAGFVLVPARSHQGGPVPSG